MRGIASAFAFLGISAMLGSAPAFAGQITSMIVPVVAVDNPQQLVSLNVVDPSGVPIGDVVKVKTGSDGKVSRVLVMLSYTEGLGRVAAIRPERLFFDRRELKLVGQFSAAEMTQLAATATVPTGVDTSQSSGMVTRHLSNGGDDQSTPYNPQGHVMPY